MPVGVGLTCDEQALVFPGSHPRRRFGLRSRLSSSSAYATAIVLESLQMRKYQASCASAVDGAASRMFLREFVHGTSRLPRNDLVIVMELPPLEEISPSWICGLIRETTRSLRTASYVISSYGIASYGKTSCTLSCCGINFWDVQWVKAYGRLHFSWTSECVPEVSHAQD